MQRQIWVNSDGIGSGWPTALTLKGRRTGKQLEDHLWSFLSMGENRSQLNIWTSWCSGPHADSGLRRLIWGLGLWIFIVMSMSLNNEPLRIARIQKLWNKTGEAFELTWFLLLEVSTGSPRSSVRSPYTHPIDSAGKVFCAVPSFWKPTNDHFVLACVSYFFEH